MIAAAPLQPEVGLPFEEAKAIGPPAFYFPKGSAIATVGLPGEQEFHFEGEHAIFLRLFSKTSENQPKVGRAKLKEVFYEKRRVSPMASLVGCMPCSNDYGLISIDPYGNNTTKGITQGFGTGELWGVNSQVFVNTVFNRYVAPAESIVALAVIAAEQIYTRTLENYISIATTEIKLGPFVVVLLAVGLRGVYMGAPHPESSAGHYYGPIREPFIIRRFEIPDINRTTVVGVLRQYFDDLYDLAECSRDQLLTDEIVAKKNIPPRNSP